MRTERIVEASLTLLRTDSIRGNGPQTKSRHDQRYVHCLKIESERLTTNSHGFGAGLGILFEDLSKDGATLVPLDDLVGCVRENDSRLDGLCQSDVWEGLGVVRESGNFLNCGCTSLRSALVRGRCVLFRLGRDLASSNVKAKLDSDVRPVSKFFGSLLDERRDPANTCGLADEPDNVDVRNSSSLLACKKASKMSSPWCDTSSTCNVLLVSAI